MYAMSLIVLVCLSVLATTRASGLVEEGFEGPSNGINEEHARLSRSLLAATDAPPVIDGSFIKENCMYMFNNGMTALVKLYKNEQSKDGSSKIVFSNEYSFSLQPEPTSRTASGCNDTTVFLKLDYSSDKVNSSNISISSVTIDLVLLVDDRVKFWALSPNSTVTIDGSSQDAKKTFNLKESDLTASAGFSFSCLNMKLTSPSPSNNTLQTISLAIKRFQIQPFSSGNPNKIFVASFDCSTWFTISLWVGLFTLLLFTSIVASGVYMLFEIKTMDRFENPKGKTITVAVGE